MQIPSVEDFQTKTYNFFNLEVVSEVVSVTHLPEGKAICVQVKSSFKSASWGTRLQVNSLTHYLANPEIDIAVSIETSRCKMAEELAKTERGLSPTPQKFLGIRVSNLDDTKGVTCLASVDLTVGLTRVQAEMVRALQLQPSGRFWFDAALRGGLVRLPLYRAKVAYGKVCFESEILPTRMNLQCVVGGTFIQQAIGKNYDWLYDLLVPPHWRALRDVSRTKKNTVLIIGKCGENTTRLREIQDVLRGRGLEGVLLQDFPDIEEQSISEKMVLFACIARYVICDDANPSGHIVELKICSDLRFTTAVLRPEGTPATAMQADIDQNCDFIRVFGYSQANRSSVLAEAISWADGKVRERAAQFNQLYKWRSPEKIFR
jgi:hypothetical protein